MKPKTLLFLLCCSVISWCNAQQIPKLKKHEIGVDLFPLLNNWDIRTPYHLNMTYKYYFKKYALKLRIGGQNWHKAGYDEILVTPSSSVKQPNLDHILLYPSVDQHIFTRIGAQYIYFATVRKKFL